MEKGLAIITGADGGMGQEITIALAKAGYSIIMACKDPEKAISAHERVCRESGNNQVEIREINLASMASVRVFAEQLLAEGRPISRLMNNAGLLTTKVRQTVDGIEPILSVNYMGPYLLTRMLLPLIQPGSRIVNTVSCTYAIGVIDSEFIPKGRKGFFNRFLVYSNTKLALLLFGRELAEQVRGKGITVNCSDPGIVSTNMIRLDSFVDPITDLIYRPLIKTPLQGASTAIHLALSDEAKDKTGCCYAECKEIKLPKRILQHPKQKQLWDETEAFLKEKGMY